MNTGAAFHGSQKRALAVLRLELEVVFSSHLGVLVAGLSSRREASVLNS